ncbi:hypothetical protein RHODO2019_15515 [Rhodococcus antarcticus]|uniref:Uncharacterized protein n=1 Tax=Rhodococcus antarcticus TaxID=2987751 RepID=A0ABY6NYP4_9NOCA|nr:hypothetical protein [Rhodococcus antarcticus]UZJ24520.1 hypothetical protein RHODO2019_15515 [Rhodococcus antarcticus]
MSDLGGEPGPPVLWRRYDDLRTVDPRYWPEPIGPLSMERVPLDPGEREPRRHPHSLASWCLTCQRNVDGNTPLCDQCAAQFDNIRRRRQRYVGATRIQVDAADLRELHELETVLFEALMKLTAAYAVGGETPDMVARLAEKIGPFVEVLNRLPRP